MRRLLIAGALIGSAMLSGEGLAQTAAPTQSACPEGQARTADGTCAVTMPATPHQMEVLKPGAGPTSPAAGAATQGAPAGGTMPTTPHQQDVLKPRGGG